MFRTVTYECFAPEHFAPGVYSTRYFETGHIAFDIPSLGRFLPRRFCHVCLCNRMFWTWTFRTRTLHTRTFNTRTYLTSACCSERFRTWKRLGSKSAVAKCWDPKYLACIQGAKRSSPICQGAKRTCAKFPDLKRPVLTCPDAKYPGSLIISSRCNTSTNVSIRLTPRK